ncbi:unnamed protein product [Ceutorhynchus assimilis]|uniref:Acyltransferase 3 domain-containing protein n=1 Tax=Ceutorhynchus assimilis TaxID=467358 RepID=A0A9N9MCZ7_9CUCU|nr:unnamed protein product [Ceutorhynchus assimilis]
MKNLSRHLIIIFILFLVYLLNNSSVEESTIPDINNKYGIQNYKKCEKSGGSFCKFDFKITSCNQTLWKTIEESQKNRLKLDKSVIHRMLCVPKDNSPMIYGKLLMEKYANGTKFEVLQMDCVNQWNFTYKRIYWTIIGVYAFIIFWVTKYNNNSRFSFIKNAKKLLEDCPSKDFRSLKSIQGIRVLNTCLVIFWHTVLSLAQTYINDVAPLEKSFENPLFFYTMFLGGFAVQIFFLISSFLLTNQILEIQRQHGSFTLKHCCIIMLHRFCRLSPILLMTLASTTSGVYDFSPHTMDFRDKCLNTCQHYWWYAIFQINFLLPIDKICMPNLWYLSVDTLFYLTTVIIMYFILKNRFNIYKMLSGIIVFVITYFALYIYLNDYEFMFQPYPKAVTNMIYSKTMTHIYINPLSNYCGSLFGLILGAIYYDNKHHKRVFSKAQKLCWYFIFTCVPLLALHLSTYSYNNRAIKSFIGAVLKPLFVFPLGIGILGMAFGLGGLIKKLLESKVMVVLSNVTYGTYAFNFYVAFAKGILSEDVLHYEQHHLILWIIFDLVISFIIGTIFTISIEYPLVSLLKEYLPKIEKSKQKSKNYDIVSKDKYSEHNKC